MIVSVHAPAHIKGIRDLCAASSVRTFPICSGLHALRRSGLHDRCPTGAIARDLESGVIQIKRTDLYRLQGLRGKLSLRQHCHGADQRPSRASIGRSRNPVAHLQATKCDLCHSLPISHGACQLLVRMMLGPHRYERSPPSINGCGRDAA